MFKSKASEAKGIKPSGFSLEFLNPASLVSGGVTAPKQEVALGTGEYHSVGVFVRPRS
jgi:hypothetical protein